MGRTRGAGAHNHDSLSFGHGSDEIILGLRKLYKMKSWADMGVLRLAF